MQAIHKIIEIVSGIIQRKLAQMYWHAQLVQETEQVNMNAAIIIKDTEAKDKLGEVVLNLLNDKNKLNELSVNIKALCKTNAADEIVTEIIN